VLRGAARQNPSAVLVRGRCRRLSRWITPPLLPLRCREIPCLVAIAGGSHPAGLPQQRHRPVQLARRRSYLPGQYCHRLTRLRTHGSVKAFTQRCDVGRRASLPASEDLTAAVRRPAARSRRERRSTACCAALRLAVMCPRPVARFACPDPRSCWCSSCGQFAWAPSACNTTPERLHAMRHAGATTER